MLGSVLGLLSGKADVEGMLVILYSSARSALWMLIFLGVS